MHIYIYMGKKSQGKDCHNFNFLLIIKLPSPQIMESTGVKRIRIFTGGRMGHTKSYFMNARGHIEAVYGDKIIVETIDTDVIKEEGRIRTPKEFIDWFLGADIHIISSHLHQGLDDLSWDMEELLEEYKRLRGHIGYTGGVLKYFIEVLNCSHTSY